MGYEQHTVGTFQGYKLVATRSDGDFILIEEVVQGIGTTS